MKRTPLNRDSDAIKFFHFILLPTHNQGEDSVEYYLGLTPSGVIVLRNKTTVAHYYWPRIGKVFHKGKYFMLRVCDKNVSIQSGLTPRDTPMSSPRAISASYYYLIRKHFPFFSFFPRAERDKHLRLRDTKESRLQTLVPLLRRTSRLLPAGPDPADTQRRRRRRRRSLQWWRWPGLNPVQQIQFFAAPQQSATNFHAPPLQPTTSTVLPRRSSL